MFNRGSLFSNLPVVVKNLLLINGLFFLGTILAASSNYSLAELLGLHHWRSDLFRPHQLVTYIFMHGGFAHLFSNMFGLFMFGRVLEQVWGPKRFLIFYILTGMGAGLIQLIVAEIRIQALLSEISPELIEHIMDKGLAIRQSGQNYIDPLAEELNNIINISTVGASGAIFGILLGFGMLFPNVELMLLFFPVPIKAKYFVTFYGLFELYQGFANNPNDNVAHFAHLGGMLIAYFLIKTWNNRPGHFH